MTQATTFTDRLIAEIRRKKSLLCVGLDPQLNKFPKPLTNQMRRLPDVWPATIQQTITEFNKAIIDATEEYAIAFKPQSAFYEPFGSSGIRALEETIRYITTKGIPVILDGKRGDGGDTADAYAQSYLGDVPCEFWEGGRLTSPLRVDALTIHGYIADDCVTRFVKEIKAHGTGAFVVTKTSFKPNSRLEQAKLENGRRVWEELAHLVAEWGEGTEGHEGYRNLGVVMGATYPEDTPKMRLILPNAWFLVPGYGAQGGGADGAVAGVNPDGFGCVVNSSRGIIYASQGEDFAAAAAKAARDARDDLNMALERKGRMASW